MENPECLENDDERIPTLEEVGLTPDDAKTFDFDPTDCLTTPKACAVWLDEAIATGDPKFVAYSLGLIAKKVGMGKVSGLSGANRAALYRTLSGKREPRIGTVMAVLDALGMRMRISLTDETAGEAA